jgi:beta-lactamase regulating signal transducer with metallopeptidase domain
MTAAIALMAKTTVVMLLGLGATRLARRARASVRHAMLLATFAILLALPLLTMLLPSVDVPILPDALSQPSASMSSLTENGPARSVIPTPATSTAGESSQPPTPWQPPFTIASASLSVWLAGAALMLASFGLAILRVERLRRDALPFLELQPTLSSLAREAQIGGPVDVTVHESIASPITCGVRRQTIVFPADAREWDRAAVSRALVHELEHCRRRDWATRAAARAVCALYWFHPLAWIIYRQLCLEAEHACDDAVVAREESASYAEQLVALARRMTARPAVAILGMAERSDLSVRVHAVLDPSRARGRAGTARAALIALSAVALVLLISPLHVVAAIDQAGARPVADDDTPVIDASSPRFDASSPGADAVSPKADAASPVRDAGSPVEQSQSPRKSSRGSRLDVALVEAAADGDLDDVRSLLDGGANVNAAVLGDGSPLIAAAREGHRALVLFLLDRGADVNLPVDGDGAPLIMAAREGHRQIVETLLDRGANIELMSPSDENALIQASAEGHLDVVRLLVDRGANVNARTWVERRWNRQGGEWRSPLSMALRGQHPDVVEFLRSVGATQ